MFLEKGGDTQHVKGVGYTLAGKKNQKSLMEAERPKLAMLIFSFFC
jgi:hypothetical protein